MIVGIAHQISPLRQRTEKRRNGLEHEVMGKGRPRERLTMSGQGQYEIMQRFRDGGLGQRKQACAAKCSQSKTSFFIHLAILSPCTS